jgi:hypothetical protein
LKVGRAACCCHGLAERMRAAAGGCSAGRALGRPGMAACRGSNGAMVPAAGRAVLRRGETGEGRLNLTDREEVATWRSSGRLTGTECDVGSRRGRGELGAALRELVASARGRWAPAAVGDGATGVGRKWWRRRCGPCSGRNGSQATRKSWRLRSVARKGGWAARGGWRCVAGSGARQRLGRGPGEVARQ